MVEDLSSQTKNRAKVVKNSLGMGGTARCAKKDQGDEEVMSRPKKSRRARYALHRNITHFVSVRDLSCPFRFT